MTFRLAGYEIDELLGFGGSGEVWRAREVATGELVALKRLRADRPEVAVTDQLRREAALMASVTHDHIVRLRAVVPTPEGLVLVLDYAEGGSLAAVLSARTPLSAGEVVTIGAPLAQALAEVHAGGLVHGDITPGNIVFDRSGKPLLTDLGVARLVAEQGTSIGATPGYADPALELGQTRPSPATDVHGLAAVCFHALAGRPPYLNGERAAPVLGPLAPGVPPGLIAAIEAALDPDPTERPDAAMFGRALFAACSPEAVRLVKVPMPVVVAETHQMMPRREAVEEPVTAGRHRWPAARRRLVVRRLLTGAVAAALLAGAVFGGVLWASHDRAASASPVPVADTASAPPVAASPVPVADTASTPAAAASPGSAAPTSASPSAAPDWSALLTALDATRDAAFIDGDESRLDQVYLPGSAALAADRLTLQRLVAAGQHAQSLQLRLLSVQAVTPTFGSPTNVVTLTVRDTLPAYTLVAADGSVQQVPGRGERRWVVVLRRQTETQWLIASIAGASGGDALTNR